VINRKVLAPRSAPLRKGVTLVEVLISATLTAVLVSTLVSLYGFVVVRSMHSYARGQVVLQAEAITSELTFAITNSKKCELVIAGTQIALKCTLPANGRDINNDGRNDEFYPTRVRALTLEEYADGRRVWYYMGEANKNFGTASPLTVIKATRMDDLLPTAADVDRNWVFYYDRPVSRWNLIGEMTFSVDSLAKMASFKIVGTTLIRGERQAPTGTPLSDMYEHTVTRTLSWRYWRP
jgi:hypothetical protein